MFPIRIKACSESDLRMLGTLARNIQRVLPVTQADIDAAAALGKGWVVWKVIEVNDPIDNLRGGTQLVIKQNSITPGQNVRRVLIVSGPSGETVVIGPGPSPLLLPDAIANSLSYVKAFGGTEQNGTPTPDTPVDIVSNNGVLKYSANMANVNAQTILLGYYISAQGVVTADTNNWIYQDYIPVSPNTTYTLTMSSPVYYVSISEYSTASDSGFVIRKAGSTGTNTTLTITTGATTNFVRFGTNIDRTEVTLEEVLAINWQLNKGSSMPYTPYSPTGIYTDGLVETINIHTANIFNKNDTASIGSWYSSSTLKITQAAANQTLVMRAKPGATYYYKHCSVTGGGRAFYTEVEDWDIGSDCSAMVGGTTIDKDEVRSITVSENAKWVFFIYGRSNQTATFEEQLADYMVSLTPLTSDTQYVPYYDGGTATAEMLLKVDDYQDEQEILSGAITRNVGVKVFDGTENVGTSNATFTIAIADRVTSKTPLVCSHFEYSTKTSSQVENLKVISFSSTNIGFRYDACADTTAFKTWLANQYAAGTPVIVVYPLAAPTTESVTGQALQVTDGDNVLEITQAGMDGLELEAEYTKVA